MGYIIDVSHHQNPAKMNYDKLASQVDLVIIRTQYGSNTIDKYYKTHHQEFKKRGIPTAAYAYVKGKSVNEMKEEAKNFYNRTKDFNPTFWFLDVEEQSMKDIRTGVKAYVQELRRLGAKKVGAYIAHHLYKQFNLDLTDFDAIWIPRYGPNNGKLHDIKPDYPCDLWQYTDKGRLDGYSGYLDLNTLTGTKPLEYFTGKEDAKVKEVFVYLEGGLISTKGVINSDGRACVPIIELIKAFNLPLVANYVGGKIYVRRKREGE